MDMQRNITPCSVFLTLLLASSTLITGMLVPSTATAQIPGRGADPMQAYYQALQVYRDGDIENAIRGFEIADRGTRTDPNGKYIDAIPARVMLAECYWQLGHLPACRLQLDQAAQIAIRHRGWLNSLDFSVINPAAQIQPATNNLWPEVAAVRLIPLPASIPMHSGRAVTEQSLAAGGVIEAPNIQNVDAIEIMRCLAILAHRRRVLLGPLAADDTLARETLEATKLPSSLNHPMGLSLLHSMRGCEYFAIGEDPTVIDRATKYASPGGVHPLTPLTLLCAMKVSVAGDDKGELSAAARDTIISTGQQITNAAAALEQFEMIGEALQVAVGVADEQQLIRVEQTALLAGRTLVRQSRLASLHCYLVAADAAVSSGRVGPASEHLQAAIALATRRDIALPRLQAYGAYIAARLAAKKGQPIGLDATGEMASALKAVADFVLNRQDRKRPVISMPFLYQADIVLTSLSGNVGNQSAKRILSGYAGPTGLSLWRQDPLNAMAATYFDDAALHASLLRIAAVENDGLEVLRQTDHVLAKRFTSRLPLQGRLLQLRTLASVPADSMWPSSREVIADPNPAFTRLRDQTQAALLVPANAEQISVRSDKEAFAMEAALSDLALSRIAVPELNPPRVAKTDVVEIPDGIALLTFAIDSGRMIATASRDGATRTWVVGGANRLPAMVSKLLQDIGAAKVKGKRLPDDASEWKSTATKIRSYLLPENSGWSEEGLKRIIIVPDGPLWYLPFELLPAQSLVAKDDKNPAEENSDAVALWADAVEVQYAPTPGLALRHAATATTGNRIAMVAGSFFAVRDAQANETMIGDVMSPATNALLATPATAPPTAYLGLEIGHLMVAAPVTPNFSDMLSTTIVPVDNTPGRSVPRTADQLRDWVRYPAGGPKSVLLAGLRTSGSTPKLGDGSELFFPMIALQASGVQEVALTRWATGGSSAATVLTEVVNEIPHTSLADALRRGTMMLRQAELSVLREPLLGNADSEATQLSGDQPLFWATYLTSGAVQLPPPASED
jgi:hypothetical protein